LGYCAVLTSSAGGGVDCWGYEPTNQGLPNPGIPAAIPGVGGHGTLTGVESLVSDDSGGFCALLASSGGVDCWGPAFLGNGTSGGSDVPVAVVGTSGAGTLAGVASLISNGVGYCAVLSASGGVDCWGYNTDGELGNGAANSSDVPVAVHGVGGAGTLSNVKNVSSDKYDSVSAGDIPSGYCAVISGSGAVDCWGTNYSGQLGDGTHTGGSCQYACSRTPVAVLGVGGTATLSTVTNVVGYGSSNCAIVTSLHGVDCWGNDFGSSGELGNGSVGGSDVPVSVLAPR
jgi:hypothetical protein